MKSVEKFTLSNSSLPNPACASANKDNLWKCFFTEELSKYVDEPIYFTQSYYDRFGIEEVLGYKWAYDTDSLEECTDEE